MEKEQEITLEEAFQKLDEVIEKLESPEATLEDSFQKYEEGMKLLKVCNDRIDQVEKKVQVLSGNGELHDFS